MSKYINENPTVTISRVKAFREEVELILVGSDGNLYSYNHSETSIEPREFYKTLTICERVVDDGKLARKFHRNELKETLEETVEEIKENFNAEEIKRIIRELI